MKYRDLAKKLTLAGFESRQGKGDHEVWTNGRHQVTITQTTEISPGLVRNALNAIEASKGDDQ
jgi:predicted RNA binding protein YcfA (HicA-like mRNA interferase family)